MKQNIALCIGKLAFSNKEIISQYLESFSKDFCLSLRKVDSIEKQEAFKGVCNVIISNPQKAVSSLAYFCDAFCEYESPTNELELLFQHILNYYYNSHYLTLNQLIESFPFELKDKMNKRFTFQIINQ